jgi:predicted ArsR family transcriptional regulator
MTTEAWAAQIVLNIVFGLLLALVVVAFKRERELAIRILTELHIAPQEPVDLAARLQVSIHRVYPLLRHLELQGAVEREEIQLSPVRAEIRGGRPAYRYYLSTRKT